MDERTPLSAGAPNAPAPFVPPTNYVPPPTSAPPLALPPEAHNANFAIAPNLDGSSPKVDFTTSGIKSDDAKLNSTPAIRDFIVANTTRPQVFIHERAWHTEYYSERVKDANGNYRWETRTREVTDLDKYVDISEYVSTYYVLHGLDQAERYVQSGNKLRKLTVKKHVDNKLENICARVRFFLSPRFQHFRCEISTRNDKIEITPDEDLSKCLRSTATDVLCFLTCLCICYYPIKYCYQEKFTIDQLFSWAINEEQIWFTKYAQLMF